MSDDTPDSLIPYDEIVQEALRAVVGRVLGEVEAAGGTLPGNHHFYITFKTGAPGVQIPQHLRERFPDEMTIVLQNKFWDLAVDDHGFQVGLSFNQIFDPREKPLWDQNFSRFGFAAKPRGKVWHAADRAIFPAAFEADGADGRVPLRYCDSEIEFMSKFAPFEF